MWSCAASGSGEMEVNMKSKVTVSLHPSLLAYLDRLARKWKTTRSGALAELLQQAEKEEIGHAVGKIRISAGE